MQKLLISKNTIEAAHAISNAFIDKFGTNYGTAQEITSKLIPRGKSPTWTSLDRNLNFLCKQFYKTWEQDEDKINFFDEIRFCLASLPMKKDYKLNETQKHYSNPEYVAQFFEPCSLCWRSVLRKPLEKKTSLCHLHDLPSTHTEYRKRARLKKYVEITRLCLIKTLPPLIHLKKELGAESETKLRMEPRTEPGINLNDCTKSLCLNEYGELPLLANYLKSLNIPLTTTQEILSALESPIYLEKASSITRQAWEFYLTDRSKHFRLTYIQLLTAEAWLRVEAERKHGGKRR